MNSTIGSSICSNAIPQIAEEFNITNQQLLVLPISIFLIGYILGPLVWGPSSEYFGRKRPMLIAFCGFMVFTLACAVSDSYASLLVFRLLNGMMASAPIATTGGLFADVHDDPTQRGRLMAYYMAVCSHEYPARKQQLLTTSVHHLWPYYGPLDLWICSRRQLAMVFLDRSHLLRRHLALDRLHARNLRPCHSKAPREEAPQGYRQLHHCVSAGGGEPQHSADVYHHDDTTIPHDSSRVDCFVDVFVPCSGVCDLLSLF